MRNFKAWFVGLSFSWLLVLTECQQPMAVDRDVNNLHRATGKQIIAFGDSITAGAGVRTEEAYPSILSQILDLPIVNRGRGGDTTATALNRLQQNAIEADPWLVIVGLGGNDYLQQVPLARTEQNLRQIVTQIQQARAVVVVLEMSVEPFNGDYEKLYQRVANDTQAYLIPGVLEGLNDPRYLYDEIHPNQAGHRIMAKRIAEGLKPLLNKATLPPNLSKLRRSEQ